MRRSNLFWWKVKGIFREHIFSFLFLGAVFFFLAGCGSKEQGSVENKFPEIKIVMAPAEGEMVADLGQPLVLFFPEAVPAADFSFSIEPDPGGWKPVWDAGRKKARLEHADAFMPLKEYRVKVAVKGGLSLKSVFKTGPADPSALLESDLAKGTISADQAAQYRVMRIFKPEAIPDKYRRRKASRSGTWDLLQAANQLEKLKPETIKQLEPYFIRPDNPHSIFYKRLFDAVPSSSQSSFSLVSTAHAAESYVKEVYHTETGYDVAIIGPQSLAAMVRKARQVVEETKMYEKFERLLHRKTFDYGDRTLYIFINPYLADVEAPEDGAFEPMGLCWNVSPTYTPGAGLSLDRSVPMIQISARQIGKDPELANVLAHEMFHAFQYAFSRFEEKWLVEGSAVWAEDFIGPDWNLEQNGLDGSTFNGKASLHNTLTEKTYDNAYGMYLFFYYLTRVRSGGGEFIMRQIWENCAAARYRTLASVQAAIGGDFKEVMKEYALFTLDKEEYQGKFPDTVGRYGGQNPLKLAEIHKFRKDWRIEKDGNIKGTAFGLAGMNIVYLEVTNEAVGMEAPTIRFDLKEFTEKEAIAIQAVIKYRDGKAVEEDWTGRDERIFCLAGKRDNFTSIYIAVSWAEENEAGDAFLLDIQPAPDVECLSGQMRITMSVKGQKQSTFTKKQIGDNRDSRLAEQWEREARFDLDLVPQREEIAGKGEELINALPGKIQKRARAEMLRPESYFDEPTQCDVYVFRVKSCRVGSFRRSMSRDATETINDAFGLQYHAERNDNETWSAGGLSTETEKWLKEKSLAVKVYADPKTNKIKWVRPAGPIGVKGKGTAYHKTQGRKRIDTYPNNTYEEISRSFSEDLEEDMMVREVSEKDEDEDEDEPMNPDWKAQQGGSGSANGRGEYKRVLDDRIEGDENEKTVISGEERHSIKWELSIDIAP